MTPLDEWWAHRRDIWPHTAFTTYRYPCPWRDSNPHSQQASCRRPPPQTARQLNGTVMYPLLKYIRFQSKRILISLLATFVTAKTRLSSGRLWGLHTAATSTEVLHWTRQSKTTILLLPQQPVSINIPSNFMLLSVTRVTIGLFPIQFLTQNSYAFLLSQPRHISSPPWPSIFPVYRKFHMSCQSRSPWL